MDEEEVSEEEDGEDSYEEVDVSHDINIDDLLNTEMQSNLANGS